MKSPECSLEDEAVLEALGPRFGQLQVRERLAIERDYEAHLFRKGTLLTRLEYWDSVPRLIRAALRLTGLYTRGRRNALSIELQYHDAAIANLPEAFDGFTILQLSDLHIDMNDDLLDVLIDKIRPLDYDLCVLTGDYRARTFGPYEAALAGMDRLRPHISTAAYAVLGNHDTIRMVPAMESMGYRFLINESVSIERDSAKLHVAGIDDAHFYGLEDYQSAVHEIPEGEASILLSHTPEAYRDAAENGFDLMLSGHTHGGQICLPGGIPVLTEADCPRQFARGAWRHKEMLGYTSVGAGTCIVDVRLNCPAEVTLHRLRRADTLGSLAPRSG
jgi:predicted MPP superfamily phosphohydrolase